MSWPALVAVIFWGASFAAAKIVLAEISPLYLVLVRAVLAAAALNLLLLWQGNWREITHLTRQDWTRIGFLVVVSVFPHQLVQMAGLRWTTAVHSALLITLSPLFMFLLSAIFFRERVGRLKGSGFLVAILGSALIITRGDPQVLRAQPQALLGDLLIVVSALGWAVYSTVSKKLLQEQPPLLIVTLVFTLSVPVLALYAQWTEGSLPDLAALTGRGWAALLFLAWACSALGYILWYRALQRHVISRVGVLQYLQPLVATLLGVFVLAEPLLWTTILGGGMIMGGVAMVNWQRA